MSNLILTYIIFMDIKRHILIYFFISMLVDRENEWHSCKMNVVIRENGRQLLRKLIGEKKSYQEKNEAVKLENELVIFEFFFGMVHRWPYERFQKTVMYHFQLLVIGINEKHY